MQLVIERGVKASATWAILVCSIVLVALLFHRMAPSSEPWTFVTDNVPSVPIRGGLEPERAVLTPPGERDFVHGASLVATPNNGLLAFWYRAVYEGANNAEIVSARFDGSAWQPTSVVTTSPRASRDIGITVKSLANPVPFRRSENEIWLFVSASRLSGWATCEIILLRSHDNGLTWGPAERIYASPFLNMSHLTKATPILMSGGRIGLPVYNEMNRKYPVLLVLNADGQVVDRRRMGNGGKVGYQPAIVTTGPSTAVAFIRRLNSGAAKKILVSRTSDGGRTWTPATPTVLSNPGGPIAAIRYDATHLLLAFNDDPEVESNITLALSDLDGSKFEIAGVAARMDDKTKDTVMYPYLISSVPGQFDIVYSRPSKAIDYVGVSSAWLQHNLQVQAAQK
jgi:predicted neuraminidase